MEKLKFVYWQDGEIWLGYLVEFPDDIMQGNRLENLKENLKEIHKELNDEKTPYIRETGEIDFP